MQRIVNIYRYITCIIILLVDILKKKLFNECMNEKLDLKKKLTTNPIHVFFVSKTSRKQNTNTTQKML